MFSRALFSEPNPIPVKWALAELGLMPGGIRLPLVPLDEWHHEDVRAALGLLENQACFLSSVQIGITLIGVLAGAFGGATLAKDLADWLAQ